MTMSGARNLRSSALKCRPEDRFRIVWKMVTRILERKRLRIKRQWQNPVLGGALLLRTPSHGSGDRKASLSRNRMKKMASYV
jgi:hypothetical protein